MPNRFLKWANTLDAAGLPDDSRTCHELQQKVPAGLDRGVDGYTYQNLLRHQILLARTRVN